MTKKEILVAYGVDVSAVASWLGSYGSDDSPDDISRGMFAGELGLPRMLKLFRKYNIAATFFTPGHSIETFPAQVRMIADGGHEIALHGYSNENPLAMTPRQEEDILLRCIDLIAKLTGKRPTGYAAPWWEFSNITGELLIKHGIKYDHSLMHDDLHPYYMRIGDSWTKVDYAKEAKEWMVPLVRGKETDLVEIPANWHLDDMPPAMFAKMGSNTCTPANPREILGMWQDTFDYCYREYDYAVFGMTVHPGVSGRPHSILAHERLIEYINAHEGVHWCTFDQIADDFLRRCPRNKQPKP